MFGTKRGPGIGESLSLSAHEPAIKEDFKTTALKKGLLNDTKGALAAEKL